MTTTFVHLHLHSEYSLYDGIVRIKPLVERVRELRMPAVAVTDWSNLYGAVKFYKSCLSKGIKPIVGVDTWVSNPDDINIPDRLVLLCRDNTGYQNICKMLSDAHIREDRSGGRVCIEKSWLMTHGDGLIALSAGMDGEIGKALLARNQKRLLRSVDDYKSIFGDRFYLELSRIGHAREDEYIDATMALAVETGVPVVATNPVQFVHEADFDAHEVRVCINDSRVLNDSRRPKRFSPQQYLRSPEEMAVLFADIPEAIVNSVEIAKRCNATLDFSTTHLPEYPVSDSMDVDQRLRGDALVGLCAQRNENENEIPSEYTARLLQELEVIIGMGFSGYFLIVADFIKWSRNNQIPVGPGRGSGAGSLVAYALGITQLDPIEHGLLFERFLNPERVSLPDFDIDFCIQGRDRVIEYVSERYGSNRVAQIITHGTMAARAVVRDVGRVMDHPYGLVDKIAKLVPFEIGMTLEKALEQEELLRERYDEEEDIRELIDMARSLEGIVRNVGKHAGGVVIAPKDLTEFTPLYCEVNNKQAVTQFDKDDLESVGLVKFDFLGLRTLTIIDKALKLVNHLRQQSQETPIVLEELPTDDGGTFELLRNCKTTALFQLESRGMKDLIQRLQPDRFDDLVALVALFRPGPLQSGMVEDFISRKHGREQVRYPHELLEPILRPTYGVILYQEQVMEIAQVLANYSLGAADLLRRAMGKKKPEEMAHQREIFVNGAKSNGIKERVATHIFDLMEKFAGYGFNKSHSAAYALISYQTAWLKAHYPAEFMAASLSADMEHTDKVVTLIAECRDLQIEVLPPNINHCQYEFSPIGESQILYGLGAIKGLGKAAIDSIVKCRIQGGEFQDIFDFCVRVDQKKINKRALEAMIRAGAMDGFGVHRASLMSTLPVALGVAGQQTHNQTAGQSDLFGVHRPEETTVRIVESPEWSDEQRLTAEKETLGLYLTGHPIDRFRDQLAQITDGFLVDLRPTNDHQVVVAGLVIGIRILNTKRGERFAFLTIDDQTARLELSVFADLYSANRDLIQKDSILVVTGQVSVDEYTGGFQMRAESLYDIEAARLAFIYLLTVHLSAERLAKNDLEKLQEILARYRDGQCAVRVHYQTATGVAEYSAGDDWKIKPTGQVIEELQSLFGEESIQLHYRKPPTEIRSKRPVRNRPMQFNRSMSS